MKSVSVAQVVLSLDESDHNVSQEPELQARKRWRTGKMEATGSQGSLVPLSNHSSTHHRGLTSLQERLADMLWYQKRKPLKQTLCMPRRVNWLAISQGAASWPRRVPRQLCYWPSALTNYSLSGHFIVSLGHSTRLPPVTQFRGFHLLDTYQLHRDSYSTDHSTSPACMH